MVVCTGVQGLENDPVRVNETSYLLQSSTGAFVGHSSRSRCVLCSSYVAFSLHSCFSFRVRPSSHSLVSHAIRRRTTTDEKQHINDEPTRYEHMHNVP